MVNKMKHVEGVITKETKLLGRKEILIKHMTGKILDIGCGEGELLIKSTLLGYDITGIDASLEEIETAKETAKLSNANIKILHKNLENLDFEKESFDTIIMGEVIEHFLYPKEIIEYVLQFLKPNGKLLITTPSGFAHPDADHKSFFFTDKALNLINKYWIFDFLPAMWLRIHTIYNINDLLNKLQNVKTTLEEIEYGDSQHPSLDLFIIINRCDK